MAILISANNGENAIKKYPPSAIIGKAIIAARIPKNFTLRGTANNWSSKPQILTHKKKSPQNSPIEILSVAFAVSGSVILLTAECAAVLTTFPRTCLPVVFIQFVRRIKIAISSK
ncbi:MAG: hypothetical protein WBP29_04715 [Candidatus Zixiibacteriota bacterium]